MLRERSDTGNKTINRSKTPLQIKVYDGNLTIGLKLAQFLGSMAFHDCLSA
jgi:hypothetical protein